MATTPPKKSTFRSRVGTVMRRSSTAFSIPGLPGRSGSATPPPPDSDTASTTGSIQAPKLERRDSSSSLKSLNKLQTPAQPAVSTPSPIPESPIREAAALSADPAPGPAKDPSPLSGQVITADTESTHGDAPVPASEQYPEPAAAPSGPRQPIPAVVVNEPTDAPPVFTDEPEELSAPPPAPAPVPFQAPSAPSTPPARVSAPPSAPITPPAQPPTSFGYFDIQHSSSPPESTVGVGVGSENPADIWAEHARAREVSASPESVGVLAQERVVSQKQSLSSVRRPGSSSSYGAPVGPPALQSRKASRSSFQPPREQELAGSTYTWSDSSHIALGSQAQSRAPVSVQDDPFVNPKPAAPAPEQTVSALSPAETIHVPEPFDPRSPRDEVMMPATEPVTIPLRPLHELISTRSSREPSGYSIDAGNYLGKSHADERRPLISSRPSTPRITTSFPLRATSSDIEHSFRSSDPPVTQPTPRWAQPPRFNVNGSARNYSYGSVSMPYADRGWYEYVLPHGLRYFGNPRKGATTDLDLRNFSKLDQVTNTIDTVDIVPEGCEIWIRPSYKGKGWGRRRTPGQLVIYWVDHRYRRILNEVPSDDLPVSGEDDRLDDEYRYWSYVEMHPAHVVLTPASRQEAADALHWSYTDRLLSHPQPIQPPFSQDECQELIRLLNDPGQQSGLSYTRMVARILLRVAHWRQVHFRPHRPLPRDISHVHTANHTPILRTLLEIIMGILCLGIPFLFVDRARYSGHFDVENNTAPPSSAPLFVIGACACLVSAIILSASVTLMSLPGLDSIARIGGLVAISCSVLSMVTSFISIFRYKSEMAQGAAQTAGEGFVLLPRRSIMLSLPLVFLAYSVAGFITGVVIYSFRSATINFAHAGMPVATKFDEYARWMVIGVLGALTGVLVASVMVSRR